MIRRATIGDFDDILALSAEFWKTTEFEEPFDPESAIKYVALAYDHDLLAIGEVSREIVCFAAGCKSPLMGNGAVYSGTELAWYVKPEHRKGLLGARLFNFMEKLAKEADIKYWCMSSLQTSSPTKVNSFYERKGYHLSECTYMRVL